MPSLISRSTMSKLILSYSIALLIPSIVDAAAFTVPTNIVTINSSTSSSNTSCRNNNNGRGCQSQKQSRGDPSSISNFSRMRSRNYKSIHRPDSSSRSSSSNSQSSALHLLPIDMDLATHMSILSPEVFSSMLTTATDATYALVEESPLTHLLQVTHFFYDCILAVTGIGFLNGLFLNRDGFSLEGDGKYVHLRSAQPGPGDHPLLQRGVLGFIKGAVPEMDQVMINGERVSLPPAASASGATTAFLRHGAVASDDPTAFVKHTFKYRAPKTDYISSLQKSVASFPGLGHMNFTAFNGRNGTDPNVDSGDSKENKEDNVHAHSWHASYMHLLDNLEKLSPLLNGSGSDYSKEIENDVQKELKDIHSILNVDMTIEESIEEFVKERNGKYGKLKLDDLSTIGNTMDDAHLDFQIEEDAHPESSSNLEVLADANTMSNHSMAADRENETIDDEFDSVEFDTTINGLTEAVEGAGQESKLEAIVGEEIGPEEIQSKETAQVPDTRIIWDFEADYGTDYLDPALEIEDAIVQDQDSITDAEVPVEDPMQEEVTFTNEENQENEYFDNESFPQDEVTTPDQINAESNFLTPESEFEGLEESRYTADPEEFMMDYANKESEKLVIPCESDNNKLDSDHVVLHDEEPENVLIMNADDNEQEEEDDEGQEDFVDAHIDAVHEDHTWSEITTPDDANDDDFKMAQGLAKAAFHAELQKKSERDRKTESTDKKAQVENDMAMVRDYVNKKSVLTGVARAQGARESMAASDLLKKLAEKERQRKFDSIGLIDPRLVEPSKARKVKKEQPVLQLEDISEVEELSEVFTEEDALVADDDHESTDDKEPSEIDDTKALVQVAPEKKVSTFSLAKKRPVIIAAAALVIGRRILTLWIGRGLLL